MYSGSESEAVLFMPPQIFGFTIAESIVRSHLSHFPLSIVMAENISLKFTRFNCIPSIKYYTDKFRQFMFNELHVFPPKPPRTRKCTYSNTR